MAKAKTVYFCQECGYESAKWMGQCPACKTWNTFVEERLETTQRGGAKAKKALASPMNIIEVSTKEEERIPTKIAELDRVLGGGIVKGSLSLVGGDPGIGKSTLLLQVCRNLANADR
jgi:DNA repair protein RadA/Sms